MPLLKLFQQFIDEYTGPRLAIRVAGGPVSLNRLGTIPGSSRILEEIQVLYSKASVCNYLIFKPEQLVCREVAEDLADPDSWYPMELDTALTCIGATSAFTTNRFRQGENRSFVCINETTWQINLPKFSEDEYRTKGPMSIAAVREWEDMLVTMFILKQLLPALDWTLPEMVTTELCE